MIRWGNKLNYGSGAPPVVVVVPTEEELLSAKALTIDSLFVKIAGIYVVMK
jgi:hypothetical protein